MLPLVQWCKPPPLTEPMSHDSPSDLSHFQPASALVAPAVSAETETETAASPEEGDKTAVSPYGWYEHPEPTSSWVRVWV